MKKLLKWVAIVFVGLIVLAIFAEKTKSPEQKAAEIAVAEKESARLGEERMAQHKQEIAALEALPAITASDIATAYSENTVAADQRFKGKKFKIVGTVTDINTDILGDPYVTLRGGVNPFMEPQFAFEKSDAAQLALLKKGSKVTIICIGKGDIAKIPMSDSCSLL